MNRQEILHSLLQNMIVGLEKLEKNNEQENVDLAYCNELNKEVTKLIETCDNLLVANCSLYQEESNDLNKDSLLNSSRTNKMIAQNSLMQEYSSARNPKTPGRTNKSVNKNRETSHEKDKLFKTKTLANLKNFTNTAKSLKSDNKSVVKTPTNNQTNKSTLLNNDKEGSTFDHSSRNKTVIVEKSETGFKKEKTKTNITFREENKNPKTPRDKQNQSTAPRKDSVKNIAEVKPQNNKNVNESALKKKEDLKRNNTTLNMTSMMNSGEKSERTKDKTKQMSNVNVTKLDKKEEKKDKSDSKKQISIIEKESLMTNISSTYGSNKNEEIPSPSNTNNKIEIKFPPVVSTESTSEMNSNNTANGDKNQPANNTTQNNEISETKVTPKKIEEVIDPQVLFEKRNKCVKHVLEKFLNKYEVPIFLGVNKTLAKSAIMYLEKNFKAEYQTAEDRVKILKEKYSVLELSKEIPAFVVARGTTKAVELLNESLYNKLFSNTAVPSEDILMPYRIYFQLINHSNASIKDDKTFWESCCSYFLTQNSGRTGDLINNSVKNFDFSDENLYKIIKIIGNREKKITPTYYSKTCGTTGLIIFLIKDAMEYAGIIVDKKTLPARTYKTYNYLVTKAKQKLDRLDEFDKKFLTGVLA